MSEEMLEPRSLSGGKQSGSEETNDEIAIQEKPCPDGYSMCGEGLPQEILVKIFSMVVDEEEAIPFLCHAAGVCRSWRSAASDSRLWREVDLSQYWITRCPLTLRWLVDNRLSRVTKLDLSRWVELNSENYVHLFRSCRQLETLNLSCCRLRRTAIRALRTLPNLQNLNLTGALNTIEKLPSVLCRMLGRLGPRLRELNLSYNHIKSCVKIMNTLMDNCPNLTVLDLTSCKISSLRSSLDIERLQRCCPKLRVLRLQDNKIPAVEADEEAVLASYGFPDLEEVNLSVSGMKYGDGSYLAYDDDFIARLLKNSPKLRDLDVSECINVSNDSLLEIPAQNLKNLKLSECFETGSDICIVGIINKWKHSLENVDLSWNEFPDGSLDQALELMGQHGTPIRSLDLTETRVSIEAIRTLLTGCRQLMMLDLTFTNILPSCAEECHEGRNKLDELLNTLS